jgi:hypothetical protein
MKAGTTAMAGATIASLFVALTVAAPCSVTAAAKPLFEDRGETVDNWDVLDLEGDAVVVPKVDSASPPGYGPTTLQLQGTRLLLMAKGVRMSEGYIVALYRELDPRAADADGIILFGAQYEDDIAAAHNVKELRAHRWLEQDNDQGFQFKRVDGRSEEYTVAEIAGLGIVTDDWNRTGWIWQKVHVDGNRFRAKFWPVQEPEPDSWQIQAEDETYSGGRIGIHVASGSIRLAYFAAGGTDIDVVPPKAYLFPSTSRTTRTDRLSFTLFTCSNKPRSIDYKLRVNCGKSGQVSVEPSGFSLKIPEGSAEFPMQLSTTAAESPGEPLTFRLVDKLSPGTCTVAIVTEDKGYGDERIVEIMSVDELEARIEQVAKRIDEVERALKKVEEPTDKIRALDLVRVTARAHLDRARNLLDEGKIDEGKRSLEFALNCVGELDGYKGVWLDEIDY